MGEVSLAAQREGSGPFGPTRHRPDAGARKLSTEPAPLPYPPSRGETGSVHHVGPVGGSPLSDAGHSDTGPPTAICRGGPPNLRVRRPGCQPVADLRERANPQVNGPCRAEKSERPYSRLRGVSWRRHADGGAARLGTCQSRRRGPSAGRRRDHDGAGGAWWPAAARRAPRAAPGRSCVAAPRATTWTVKSSARLRVPARTRVQVISRTSPARTGWRNCTSEYDAKSPSSPSVRMHISVATSPNRPERVGAVDEVAGVVGVGVGDVAAVHHGGADEPVERRVVEAIRTPFAGGSGRRGTTRPRRGWCPG